ncbi:hypothetical protein SJAV_26910 [Sulfurisphaera javensis]|uniref:Uncharacterized protein n=1 Tax=Sulfurisphaera javensis TaxID=2049879 RepID=A0AAT9GVF9_9CREN
MIFFPDVAITMQDTIDVNAEVPFQYIKLDKSVTEKFSVSNIVNSAQTIRTDIKVVRTLEGSIRRILGYEKGKKVCKQDICGTPDFIKDNLPGEIKSLIRFNHDILDVAKRQAALYAWLYNVRHAYIAIGIYKEIDELYALLKKIHLYKIEVRSTIRYEDLKRIYNSLKVVA